MNKIKLTITVLTLAVVAACGSNEGAQDLHDRLVAAGKLEISETKGFSISSFANSDSSPVMMDDQASEDFAFEEGPFSDADGEDIATLAPEDPIDEPSVELSPEPSGELGLEGEYDLDTADFEVTSVAPKKENGKMNTTKGIDNEAVSESAPVYFVTFQDVNFAVEKNGKTVLEGEWQAIDDNTISVDMNGGNEELNVELSGSKITLADNVEEYSDSTSSSASSDNIEKPQIGASEDNSSTYSKPHKRTCGNVWGYSYGYSYGYNPASGKYDYHYGPTYGQTQNCY